jgi:hypothetical protein
VLILFGVLLLAALAYTVIGYPKRYGALSGKSRLFRVAGLGLLNLLLILVLIYLASHFVGRIGAIQKMAFLAGFVGLVLSIVCVALLDVLESLTVLRREERAAMQQAIEAATVAAAKRPQTNRQ